VLAVDLSAFGGWPLGGGGGWMGGGGEIARVKNCDMRAWSSEKIKLIFQKQNTPLCTYALQACFQMPKICMCSKKQLYTLLRCTHVWHTNMHHTHE